MDLNTKVADINWGGVYRHTRISNCLRYIASEHYGPGKIETIADLLRWREGELLQMPNFGRGSLSVVVAVLRKHGFKLAEPF